MGLGVLESKLMQHVPGTTRYFDDPERPQIATSTTAGLKCDRSGRIILVPQPSDDPNDPLNWPLWKRDIILLILSVVSIFATSLGPILAANTLTLSLFFETKFTKIAILTGWFLFGVGIAGIFFVPAARIYGKRHLFLLGTLLVVICSIWAGLSRSYGSLAGARFFQGVATAPFEALVNVAVGDLYFVHERGKRMALSNVAVFGGAFFTPILVGKITHTIGWPWSFYFVAIFTAVCFPLMFFYVPETSYRRSAYLNTDLTSSDDVRTYGDGSHNSHELRTSDGETQSNRPDPAVEETGEKLVTPPQNTQLPNQHTETEASTPKKSSREMLQIFSGTYSDIPAYTLLARPFPLFAHPAVLWACIIQGAMIGWTVFIGIILAAVFLGPPLYWNEVNTGYAYTGAFIGAIVGFIIAGALSDVSAKWMTKKNNGIYEPEFRIILVIPQLVFGCAGLFLFGVTSARLVNYSWVLPVFAFGLQVGGMVIGAVAASLYIVDAHRDIAIEAFTCILIFKNFFCFGLTFSAYEWVVKGGIFKTFMWISAIQVVICLLSIPMYVFGKRNRSFFHRHNILKLCGLA